MLPLTMGLAMLFAVPGSAKTMPGKWIPVDRTEKIADYIKTWDQGKNYHASIKIDTKHNVCSVDGEITSFGSFFHLKPGEVKEITSSVHSTMEYFKNSVYDARDQKDGTIEVTAPYQTGRILLYDEDGLEDTFGADHVLYYEKYHQYVLQYESQELTQQAYRKLTKMYSPEDCFLDEIYSTEDVFSSMAWGTPTMGMDHLKNSAYFSGSGENKITQKVKVAILDTGINPNHEMFDGRVITSDSYDFVGYSSKMKDYYGHGTSVASVVVDSTPDNVEIMMLTVGDHNGYISTLDVANASEYALDHNADIISGSFGFEMNDGQKLTFMDKAINLAYEKNIPVVISAGNENMDVKYSYPASNEKTIAVAATNSENMRSYFSNYGKGVDFCAPGEDLNLADKNGGYYKASGTSFSCPYIAAAFSYIKMVKPKCTIKEAYDLLKLYAEDLGEYGKDQEYGWGLPDLTYFLDDQMGQHSHHRWYYDSSSTSENQMVCQVCGAKKSLSKKCGDKMTWTIKGETLTISGSGAMDKHDLGDYPWDSMHPTVTQISIGKNVTSIPDNAFASLSSVKKYVVESGSKSFVGDGCLFYTYGKKRLIAIGRDESQKTVQIDAAQIGPYAGYQNKVLQTVVFKADKLSIEGEAFKNCRSLKNICFWKNISKISATAFSGVHANVYQEENTNGKSGNYGGNLNWERYNHHPKDWSYEYDAKWEYSGKEICPEVTISSDMSLKLDYTLTYHNNIFPGKAYIRITGKGCFGESVDLPFTILGNISAKDIGVTKITSAANKGGGVEIKWTKAKNAQKYAVYRKKAKGKWTKVTTTGKTSYYDTKANKNAATYEYKIYGVTGSVKGKACASKKVVFYTRPGSFKVKKATSKKITVTWKKNAKAAGYTIQYGTDKDFSKDVKAIEIKRGSVQSATITFPGGTGSKKLYARMRCYKKKSYSAWTKIIVLK